MSSLNADQTVAHLTNFYAMRAFYKRTPGVSGTWAKRKWGAAKGKESRLVLLNQSSESEGDAST